MKKRDFNIAYVVAELRAKKAIVKFNQEFTNAQGNNTQYQNPSEQRPAVQPANNAGGNPSQQPVGNVVSGQSGY